jgi:hypothetical protein
MGRQERQERQEGEEKAKMGDGREWRHISIFNLRIFFLGVLGGSISSVEPDIHPS